MSCCMLEKQVDYLVVNCAKCSKEESAVTFTLQKTEIVTAVYLLDSLRSVGWAICTDGSEMRNWSALCPKCAKEFTTAMLKIRTKECIKSGASFEKL